MAPNRRKSKAPSAAAAAAARQKWKVGDLVLAKVKGFPAWPATVSEPEKWGYKPDNKKVLVFFFGTNQIAFCSHVDVEAFTEEKKQSLQGKRYGKSADFVRAVKEIIESYDKLKTQAQEDDHNPGFGATATNGETSVGSLVNPGTNEPMHSDSDPLIPQLQNGSFSTKDKLEGSPPLDDAASVKDENQNSPRITSISGTLAECSHVLRKKPEVMDSLAHVNLRRAPSNRRSRSSRIDACRQQDNDLPSEDSVAGTGNIVSSALCNGSIRNAIPGISPPRDEKHADSPLLVSNSNPEDNASGIASLGCNSIKMTEGSTFDSTCIPEHTGMAGNLNENVGLAKKHGLDIKAVFVKKKRKPNRKRFPSDSQELTASVDNADLVFGVHNFRLNSPNACEKSNESPSKVDCDEYLPLVKRARVRMDKLSDVEGHVDVLMVDVEEKSTYGCSLDVLNGSSLNSLDNHSSKEQDLIMLKEPTVVSVTQADSTILANGAEPDSFCEVLPCDKVDGEGGLRPSMRLHQSLETISADTPEDSQPCDEKQLLKSPSVIVGGVSSSAEVAAAVTRSGVGDVHLGTKVNACNNGMEVEMATDVGILNPLPVSKIPSIEIAEINQCSVSSPTLVEAGINNAANNISGADSLPLDTEEQNDRYVNTQFSGNQFLQYNEKKSSDSSQGIAEPPDHKISSSNNTKMNKSVVRKDDDDEDTSKISHNTDPDMCCEDENIHTEIVQLPPNGKMPAHSMSAHEGELKVDLSLKSGTSIEVMDIQHDSSQLASVSDERSSEKVVLGVQTSPSSISGPMLPSPSVSSLLSINSTQKSSILQKNGFFCPLDKLLVKREESTADADVSRYGSMGSYGKVTHYVEAKASLTSFGNALGTLTRTKDSIGRATRMAIDCAKAGLASKVVDILSRTLENESNLNRKVDLFFLVDSMMQCSRGLKGEVGGIYPSAIQAALPRLLSAAAPAGNAANENRRQCLKVLKLWLERRILPDSVIRHHMQNLDSFSSGSYSSGLFSRRSSRTERAFHDPLREMEGMLVDEYGSNSSFQLSGFCMPRMRKDDSEDSDSDGSFEAVTPEHNSGTPEEPERSAGERHRHILEDVDGELEMEDVAPSEAEMNSTNDAGGISSRISNSASLSAPPLPSDVPPSSPPLPTSPPPPPPPHVHPPPPLPSHVPHQNHSMPGPSLHPPPAIHSRPAPHPVCLPHGHSLPPNSAHPLPPHPSIHHLPPSAAGCPPPVYPPIPAHPPPDMIADGADSMAFRNRNNSVDNLPPISQRKRPTYGDSADFRASDRHVTQRQMSVPDPSTSCSFDSFSGPRHASHSTNCHSVQTSNGVRHAECPNYDNRGYNAPPPPPLGPPNNFPSFQGDHRGHHSWREGPPWRDGPPRSYANNYSRGPSRDDRNHYNDHNWRKPGSQERYEDRRYYGPPFPGDKGGGPYPPHPYVAPSNEHSRGRQWWGYPPREMHHRNSMSVRPSSEGPRYWRE